MYLRDIETHFNRPERNPDYVETRPSSSISVFQQLARPFGKSTSIMLTQEELEKVRWYILNNTEKLQPYLDEHASLLRSQGLDELDIHHTQITEFPNWFGNKIRVKYAEADSTISDDLYALANEPNLIVHSYPGCMVNGVRYQTKMRDDRRTTQNSGVCVEAAYDGASSDFFGVIDEIWEVTFLYWNKVILFKCSWFDTDNGRMKKEYNFTTIKTDSLWFENEPYVLADQVKQVYYINDEKKGDSWKVVQKVSHRNIWENVPKTTNEEQQEDNVDDDAYQEELSNEIDISFDSTNVDQAPLNRLDIGPLEIDGFTIDIEIDPNDEIDEQINDDTEETDSPTNIETYSAYSD